MKESPESLSAIAAESAELGLRSPTNQSGHAKSFKKVPPVSGEAAVQAFKMPTYRVRWVGQASTFICSKLVAVHMIATNDRNGNLIFP